MASFGTQFHALESELAAFVERWMETYGVQATILTFHPFRAQRLNKENIPDELMQPRFAKIIFTLKTPDLSETSQLALADKNPGSLFMNIGRLGPRGLEQSSLSTMDANPIWQKINSELKRATTAGAVARHELDGAEGFSRNQRFTPGAKALFRSGTPLRPDAQSPVIFLPN